MWCVWCLQPTMKRIILAVVPGLIVACGGVDKAKVELDKVETSYAAAETAPGNWDRITTEVESPHPYRNNFRRGWEVRGSADAVQLRIVFDRFELESNYDFVNITDANGGQLTRHTGDLTGTEVVLDGNRAKITMVTDYSVTDWGFSASAFEKKGCFCAEIFQPVCGVDGTTYGNNCEASCAGVDVRYQGECRNDWFGVQRRIESPHPYANDRSDNFVIREGGARVIRAHFETIDVEQGYDFVNILDGDDKLVVRYTGKHSNITTPIITGGVMKVQLVTDYSVTKFGFVVDKYEVQGGCESDAECGTGNECIQPTCIRAPCFKMCAPAAGGGVANVTLAELNAAPERFDGRKVRLTAEPTATLARCTRRGCSQADPCCNTCSAGYQLDGNVALESAHGANWGCSGNECNWQNSCEGFLTSEQNGPYEMEGTFSVGANNAKTLSVDWSRAADCQHRGCSNQACANTPIFTTCDARPEYACYAAAVCAPQRAGHCGFTQTPELQSCLANINGPRSVTVASTDTPLAIPDNAPEGQESVIIVPDVGQIRTAKVSLNISHTYRGDLVVTLTAPNGTQAVLHNKSGGSADDVVISGLELEEMQMGPSAGQWQLHVVDSYRLDVGTIDSWSIAINE